jgi:hypothetical protein
MKKTAFTLLAILSGLCTFAQETEMQTDTLRKDALNVFMEASDYIRREIPYINYVRDIKDADVYIISTVQPTGSGGREYTYYLMGQHLCGGMSDTVSFTTLPDDTYDARRQKEVATLKMGLMRYVARTPLARYISIRFTEPISETVSTDKWDSWVFRPSIFAYLQGEKSVKSSYISTRINVNRITEKWKINLGLYYNFSQDKYETEEVSYTSDYRSSYFNSLVVKSISDHWSYGGSVNLRSSSFNNLDFKLEALPGIEYDLYPYSESTRRQLRFLYRIGYSYVNYTDTTIYDKLEEHLGLHTLDIAYQVVQKWGSIDVMMGYRNYLHDWTKNNLVFSGGIELRIAKGLNVEIYGSYSIIHDQLGLVKGGLTPEQVLTRQREMETNYSYYTNVGLSYTFGSIYNNVVNPRFGDSW